MHLCMTEDKICQLLEKDNGPKSAVYLGQKKFEKSNYWGFITKHKIKQQLLQDKGHKILGLDNFSEIVSYLSQKNLEEIDY